MMYEDAIIGIFQMKIISNDHLQTVEWCLSCELSVHLKSPSEFHMPFHFIWSQVFSSWRNSSPLVFVLWYLCSTWLCWFLGFFLQDFCHITNKEHIEPAQWGRIIFIQAVLLAFPISWRVQRSLHSHVYKHRVVEGKDHNYTMFWPSSRFNTSSHALTGWSAGCRKYCSQDILA